MSDKTGGIDPSCEYLMQEVDDNAHTTILFCFFIIVSASSLMVTLRNFYNQLPKTKVSYFLSHDLRDPYYCPC